MLKGKKGFKKSIRKSGFMNKTFTGHSYQMVCDFRLKRLN